MDDVNLEADFVEMMEDVLDVDDFDLPMEMEMVNEQNLPVAMPVDEDAVFHDRDHHPQDEVDLLDLPPHLRIGDRPLRMLGHHQARLAERREERMAAMRHRGIRMRALVAAERNAFALGPERLAANAQRNPPPPARRGIMNMFRRRFFQNNAGPVGAPPPRPHLEEDNDVMDVMHMRALRLDAMRLLQPNNGAPQPSHNRFLFDLIREDLSCYLHTGNPNRNCQNIVRICRETPESIHYVDDRTHRTPLHEAALRCSCIHTMQALVETQHARIPDSSARLMTNDSDGNCPLQLYLIGMSRKSMMASDSVPNVLELLMGTPANNIPARKNRLGNNSLHLACSAPQSMVPSVIVETLLPRMLNGPTIPNSNRKTPLHVHCDRPEASVEVARMLVENVADNDVPFSYDSNRKTPVFYAAQRGNGPLVEYLIQALPNCVTQRTSDRCETILHLFPGIQTTTLSLILRKAPELLSVRTTDTLMTPLNTLLADARLDASLEIVRMMVVQDPGILLLADKFGYLPIHYACQTSRETDIVRLLMTPQTASAVTVKNDTALSIAAGQNASLETVQMLIEAYKPALQKANNYGFLPLHCVCRSPRPKEAIIRVLIDAFPEARLLQTHAGELPLHLAHKGASKASLHILGHDENSVSALDTLVSKNKIGNTPLHSACLNLTNIENIETMAEDHPEWLLTVNNAGYNPVQLLCRKGLINERLVCAIYNLVGVRPFESVDTSGHTPLHSAIGSSSEEAIRSLIEVYPDALKMKTIYGDTPLHLACHRNVTFIGAVAKLTCENATQHGSHTSPLLIRNKAGQTPIEIAMAELKATQGPCLAQAHDYAHVAALIKILYFGVESFEEGGIVEACLGLHRHGEVLHPSFIRKVIADHPEEVRVPDKEGNYPLHVEASIPVEKMILLDGKFCGCRDVHCSSRRAVLKTLLDIFPEATKDSNKNGYTVLDLMMKNGRPWDPTFAFIVRANPCALHSIDNHELMPMLIARIGNGCGPTTLYTFLRARPNLIMKNS